MSQIKSSFYYQFLTQILYHSTLSLERFCHSNFYVELLSFPSRYLLGAVEAGPLLAQLPEATSQLGLRDGRGSGRGICLPVAWRGVGLG